MIFFIGNFLITGFDTSVTIRYNQKFYKLRIHTQINKDVIQIVNKAFV